MIWAWERPEHLRGLDAGVGVAFLAQTITIAGPQVLVEKRRQPLDVDASTPLMAVTRIEVTDTPGFRPASFEIQQVAASIAQTADAGRVRAVQIDFDAPLSLRDFYKRLVRALRSHPGFELPISVTALASWCVGDAWLTGLPVDEIVPALFRMGPTNQLYQPIGAAASWPARECRDAVGVSLDEPVTLHARPPRVYVFNPRSWSAASLANARAASTPRTP